MTKTVTNNIILNTAITILIAIQAYNVYDNTMLRDKMYEMSKDISEINRSLSITQTKLDGYTKQVDEDIIMLDAKGNICDERINELDKDIRANKADIARITGLTPATVSNITNRLLELKLIHVVGPGKSSGGRRPLIFEFYPKAFYLVGIKIGISKTIAIIMDPHGTIQIKRRLVF